MPELAPAEGKDVMTASILAGVLNDCVDYHSLLIDNDTPLVMKFNRFHSSEPAMVVRTLNDNRSVHCLTDLPPKVFEKLSFNTDEISISVRCNIGLLSSTLACFRPGDVIHITAGEKFYIESRDGATGFLLPATVSDENNSTPGILPSKKLASAIVGTRDLAASLKAMSVSDASLQIMITDRSIEFTTADDSEIKVMSRIEGQELAIRGQVSTEDLACFYTTLAIYDVVRKISANVPTVELSVREDRHLDIEWTIGGGGVGRFTFGYREYAH